jgi:MFS family permease
MSLIAELKRRNVLRVAAGYIVAAWLVVQLVETIFPAFGFGDEAVRFVVIGFAVGFIPVVVAAWVLEWTPEGIRKDEGVERHGPAVAAAAKHWDRIVMVILAAAVAFFIVENILERPIDVEPTISVLPFTGIGSDAELEYLLAGVAEGIHTSLARIPELVVSAWPTVVKLRSDGLDAVEITA